MKKLFCFFAALFCVCGSSAAMANFSKNSPTNLSANFSVDFQFSPNNNKIAGVYWLPDYLGGNNGYGGKDNNGGKDEVTPSCVKEKPNSNLYDFTTSMQNAQICYTKKCKSKFIYTSANCSGEYQVAGLDCEGKYEGCVGKPCSNGGYFDSTQTNKKCSPVTYGGKTCQSCYTPPCSEDGFQTSSTKTGYTCSPLPYYGQTCYNCAVDHCYGLTEPTQPFGCKSVYAQCPSKCEVANTDNCHVRTAVNTPYGCQSNFADCSSKCEVAYPDNCRNLTNKDCEFGCAANFGDCSSKCETCKTNPDCSVTEPACTYGCESNNSCGKCAKCYADNCHNRMNVDASRFGCKSYFSDCPSKCEVAYNDYCHNLTAVPTPYGCQYYYSDCLSKCQIAYPDNCHNRTEVSVPSNGYCSSKFGDCSSKCSAWDCNAGFRKSGDKCVTVCSPTICADYTLNYCPASHNCESCNDGCGLLKYKSVFNPCDCEYGAKRDDSGGLIGDWRCCTQAESPDPIPGKPASAMKCIRCNAY